MYDPAQQNDYFPQREPQRMVFDGKRMRKAIVRQTVDYNSTAISWSEERAYQKDSQSTASLQPDPQYIRNMLPPSAWEDNAMSSVTSKYVHTSTNKVRHPINVVAWTPEGRRLITGATSGEFTLWNGLTFNFETILQAHDTALRAMVWSHNENWMVTGDHSGTVKYWQSNMNNVKAFSAHKESVRDISFAPTDLKFATCSDDVTVKIWDFTNCENPENTLTGHGSDVKSISWHPYKSLVASGGKDSRVKIWDVKSGKNITTLHGHKNTVTKVRCNKNGNWLLTASRDQLAKLYDIRTMKEIQSFRGHKRDVSSIAWHPFHEDYFVSGGWDGSLLFWTVGSDEPQGEVLAAHESSVWDLAWHPLGHILVSGANDYTTKFWCRQRPGDTMKDKYHFAGTSSSTGSGANTTNTTVNPNDPSAIDPAAALGGGSFVPGQHAITSIPGIGDSVSAAPLGAPIPAAAMGIPGFGGIPGLGGPHHGPGIHAMGGMPPGMGMGGPAGMGMGPGSYPPHMGHMPHLPPGSAPMGGGFPGASGFPYPPPHGVYGVKGGPPPMGMGLYGKPPPHMFPGGPPGGPGTYPPPNSSYGNHQGPSQPPFRPPHGGPPFGGGMPPRHY